MILIEISSPAGRFDHRDRSTIVEQIWSFILNADHAPTETMQRARQMSHLGFRELAEWHTGDGPADSEGAPPVIASVTVPRAWQEDTARPMIGAVKAAIRRVDNDHEWTRSPGSLWVLVNGVPDGSIGMDGKSSTAEDVLQALISDYQAAVREGRKVAAPDGHLVDPMCGMFVRPGPGAITLEHHGETLGFCASGCRDAYRAEHALK